MCGILGQLNSHRKIDIACFERMRDTLYHRGPDGAGTEILNNGLVAFGHRRLSIIDLSEDGRQPMCNEDQTVWLTFNGEIYNFQKVKKLLEQKGHVFKSKSDSEVLIHGYEEWGMDGLLPKLKGMFAFAIWDEKLKRLFAARDRFGMKPFYYYQDEQQFIFASEIKAIIKATDVSKSLDESALADFFIYSYVPNPKSIWKHIRKLPPAHYFTYSPADQKIKLTEYWKLRIDDNIIRESEAVEKAHELIKLATQEHLISDVPVGLFLSGGYDSTYLLNQMTDLGYDVSSFSIGFENSARSEHHQARNIAKKFEANHHETVLQEDMDTFALLEKLAYFYDEPFAISSMIPFYYVSNFASNHTKVAIAGDGGDEAFAGYNWHYNINKYYSNPTWKKKLKQLYYGKEQLFLSQYNRWMTGVSKQVLSSNILNEDLAKRIKDQGFWLFKENYLKDQNPVKAFQYLDFKTFIPEPCLTRADRSSMANSLEVRVPFLDHEIFEFSFQLKTSVYFKKKVKKYLIRENLKKRLDNKILDMPKRGFSFQHLDKIFDQRFKAIMREGMLRKEGILNKKLDIESQSNIVKFHLLILEFWFQKYYN